MGQKSGRREKEYSTLTLGHSGLPLISTSFGWHIPILYLSFLNVEVGNALGNRFARLSLERVIERQSHHSFGAHECKITLERYV